MTQVFEREVLPDGSVRIRSHKTEFVFTRPKASVLVVTITGYDKGQLGTAPLDEIGSALRVAAPVQLFVDARNAVGATVRVSEDWTRFLTRHAADLEHVHVLVGSKMVELTVAIARHLSRIERLMQIYSDPGIFETQLEAACRRHAS
ncbi:MAG: STAS/SEC14 domain-containing protein [Lysobacterales bacterium]|nr:MAG: STAS/SEC14 domain-containing protein [Xanthomonadales bacterium]